VDNVTSIQFFFPKLVFKNFRVIRPLTPNDPYSGRTAPLTSKVVFYIFIKQIFSNMVYTLRFFFFQNAVCFIIITCLVLVLFTFYIQNVLK
jgi:hypothetical protein